MTGGKGLPHKWDKETDVVIVGFGATGAAAAVEAHDAGAEAVILEKMSHPGGNTLMSGGMVLGANTSVQKLKGVEDTPEEMLKFLRAVADGLADDDRMRVCVEMSSENIDWLMKLGVKFPTELLTFTGMERLPQYAAVTPPIPRGHQVTRRNGVGLMKPLTQAIEKRGIEVMRQNPVRTLIANPATGEVVGVKIDRLAIKARRAVILATGGFSRNEEMVKNYLTPYLGTLARGAKAGIDGDGIRMAQALGAGLVNMGLLEPIVLGVVKRFITVPPDRKVAVVAMPDITNYKLAPCILVDKKGRRFTDEYTPHYLGGKMVSQLPEKTCFCIFDQRTLDMGARKILRGGSEGLKKEIEQGVVKKAATIPELSRKIGVDSDILQNTVLVFNENVEKGVDPDFGRTLHLVPVKSPPFYTMEYRPTFPLTPGGLKINTKSQVIDVFGRVIPRLYAGGETTGGWMGKYYPGGGYSLMHCFATGRIAGRLAAAERPW